MLKVLAVALSVVGMFFSLLVIARAESLLFIFLGLLFLAANLFMLILNIKRNRRR